MRNNIHEPYRKFKGALRERGLTYADVANALNISETAVVFKINGKSDFYLSEAERIEDKYGISVDIFLG